jgi:photosystem II stability/assembly factor-like uncharacterized protein
VPGFLRRTPRRGIRVAVATVLAIVPLGTAWFTSQSAFAKSGVDAAAAPFTTSPLRLESLAFSNPIDGYGLFSKVSANGQRCFDYVGRTSDGGANFSDIVLAHEWNCANGELPSTLTFDAQGDGFLYGPSLSVTHDGGRTWTNQHPAGAVVAITGIGRSLWKLESICTKGESRTSGECPLLLETSSDGGRAWTISSTFPRNVEVPARTGSFLTTGQTLLIHVSTLVDYVVLPPIVNFKGTTDHARLWYTATGGATWVRRTVACGIDALSLSLSATPSGALIGVCASGPSTGFQPKSTIRSLDSGKTWTTLNACDPTGASTDQHCSSPLNNGYLGSIDAASNEAVFEVGGRSSLNVTWDGGRTWAPVQPLLGGSDAGTDQVTFFNSRDGTVLVDANNEIATTSDGGRTWTRHIAKINGRSYASTELNEG